MLILSGKINRTLAAIIGGTGIVVVGILFEVFSYEIALGFIEFEVLLILIGTFIITVAAEEAKIFEFTAIKFLKISKGEPLRLFILFSFLIVILSTILSNLVAMVIVASLTIVACKNLELDPKPYIFGEAIFANVGGLMTLISSVPNILVSLVAGISFLDFLIYSIPLSLVITAVTFQVLIHLFKIKKPLSNEQREGLKEKVGKFDEWSVIEDKKTFYRSISVMAITLVLLASADFLGIGLGLIAIIGGVSMLLVSHVETEKILQKIDWSVIFFVSSLLILVGGLTEAGILQTFSEPLIELASSNFLVVAISILWIVGLLSSIIVDIPLTAAFIPIVQVITSSLGPNSVLLWWAIIFGVSLGANFTPIGSSSTIIALGILRKQQQVSFKEFSKIGIIVCTIQLVIGSLYLIGLYTLFPI
ncbi:anion permease [Candidatus Bathyarchaeota archaeon]|nr:anion permease [Candidatus Bathyarchaeota archaeon]